MENVEFANIPEPFFDVCFSVSPNNTTPEGFFAQKNDAKSTKYDAKEQQYDAKMVCPIFA